MEKEKHILLGVDGSPGSREAVNYIGSVFAGNPDVYVDILHVLPPIPPLFSQPEGDMDELRRLQDGAALFEKKYRNQAASIMEKAEHILAQHGMKEGNFRFFGEAPNNRTGKGIPFSGKRRRLRCHCDRTSRYEPDRGTLHGKRHKQRAPACKKGHGLCG